jgi:DNA polymerase-3 subunit alpha
VVRPIRKTIPNMAVFAHLHVHTQYSILDGASNISTLIDKVKSLDMEAIAITDHGNMFGVKEFHNYATKKGIKPVIKIQ